jgi:hypothetical protein
MLSENFNILGQTICDSDIKMLSLLTSSGSHSEIYSVKFKSCGTCIVKVVDTSTLELYDKFIKEVELQKRASDYEIAPKVNSCYSCKGRGFIIMKQLTKSISDDIVNSPAGIEHIKKW